MNYRHGFHAGNFADCVKHALLLWVVRALQRKPTPLRVLDTHAGAGAHALLEGSAARTEEWRAGIGRLAGVRDGPLADYVALVHTLGMPGTYAGSPALLRAALRPDDRLICCELHPEEHAALRARFRHDPQVAVHCRDGWEALRGLTPFPERRGLVLMDPPFERPGEFDRILAGVAVVASRFRPVQMAWYPIKHRAPVRSFHAALRASGLRDLLAAELWLRDPTDAQRLNGCGLILADAPFGFEAAARDILAALLARLGDRDAGEDWAVTRLADE